MGDKSDTLVVLFKGKKFATGERRSFLPLLSPRTHGFSPPPYGIFQRPHGFFK